MKKLIIIKSIQNTHNIVNINSWYEGKIQLIESDEPLTHEPESLKLLTVHKSKDIKRQTQLIGINRQKRNVDVNSKVHITMDKCITNGLKQIQIFLHENEGLSLVVYLQLNNELIKLETWCND